MLGAQVDAHAVGCKIREACAPARARASHELLAGAEKASRRGVEARLDDARVEMRETGVGRQPGDDGSARVELLAGSAREGHVAIARAAAVRVSRVVDHLAEALIEIRGADR